MIFSPFECESFEFLSRTTYTDYPSPTYSQYLSKLPIITEKYNNSLYITHEELKKNMVALNIYYESLAYTNIKENAQTELSDLISNIGKY